jgi:hypothetical protein
VLQTPQLTSAELSTVLTALVATEDQLLDLPYPGGHAGHLDHQVHHVPCHLLGQPNGEVHEGTSNNKLKEISADADHGAGFLEVAEGEEGRLVSLGKAELLELMSF